jgi:hypothetical protein
VEEKRPGFNYQSEEAPVSKPLALETKDVAYATLQRLLAFGPHTRRLLQSLAGASKLRELFGNRLFTLLGARGLDGDKPSRLPERIQSETDNPMKCSSLFTLLQEPSKATVGGGNFGEIIYPATASCWNNDCFLKKVRHWVSRCGSLFGLLLQRQS